MAIRVGTLVRWEDEDGAQYGVALRRPKPKVPDGMMWVHQISGHSKHCTLITLEQSRVVALAASDCPPELRLTSGHVREVCKPGSGRDSCRYLVYGVSYISCVRGTYAQLMLSRDGGTHNGAHNCPGRLGTIQFTLKEKPKEG